MTCGCNGAKTNNGSMKMLGGMLKFNDCGCGCGGGKARDKFMISVLSALIFYIVAHPKKFSVMRNILGDWVSSAAGCPTALGLFLHSVVFFFIVFGLMNIKNIQGK